MFVLCIVCVDGVVLFIVLQPPGGNPIAVKYIHTSYHIKCVLYYCHRVSTQLQLTNISISYQNLRIPVAAPSKTWVCGCSLAGIAGSNRAGAWMAVSFRRCVLSDRGHCVGPIIRPGKSCRMRCVLPERDREASILRTPWPIRGCQAMMGADLKTLTCVTCFGHSIMGHGCFLAQVL